MTYNGPGAVPEHEGQNAEFKTGFETGARRAAIDSLVAFINASGGIVYFGVRNDGSVVGVELGVDSLDKLAARIRRQTYPSIPVEMRELTIDGRQVLAVETWADKPPVVGVYLVSDTPIADDQTVPTAPMACFRRVGSTDQRENFMYLRAELQSDPHVSMRLAGGGTRGTHVLRQGRIEYSNVGAGWAHDVTPRAEHPLYTVQVSGMEANLPPPDQDPPRPRNRLREASIHVTDDQEKGASSDPIVLIAEYRDSIGLRWESRLPLIPHGNERFDEGQRTRRITELPSKAELAGR